MKKNILMILFIIICCTTTYVISTFNPNKDKLVIIWTSDDVMVANRIALTYPLNSLKKGWFEQVELVIWGPSAKLVADNKQIQETVLNLKENGVTVSACLACAKAYGVDEKLKTIGFDVKYMGLPTAQYLKTGYNVLTF